MTVLITGAAGFIGFHTSLALLDRGDEVVGIDNVNDYYDVPLKEARLKALSERDGFIFERLDIADREAMAGLIADVRQGRFKPDDAVIFVHTGGTPALFAYRDELMEMIGPRG